MICSVGGSGVFEKEELDVAGRVGVMRVFGRRVVRRTFEMEEVANVG